MSEPTDTGDTDTGKTDTGDTGIDHGAGPAPKGSAPAPGFGSGTGSSSSASSASATSASEPESASTGPRHSTDSPTTAFPSNQQHRAEGSWGGVATAYSGGAAGRAAPMIPPSERRGPMESVLTLRRIDPWSAFTTVLGLMFALYLVWMVAVGVVYLLLSGMGVWDRLGGLLSGVAGDASATAIGPSTIFLYAGGVGLLNVLLLSILTTLAVFIYNLAAGLTGGGVQMTLGDRRR